jgi:uncharacterized short protein YbdD (DUF466 family)
MVIFKDMRVNNIYLNLQKDQAFIVLKTGVKYHTIYYEAGGTSKQLTPDRMDLITTLSKPAETNARKILHEALEKKAEHQDNVFGNLKINVNPILDWTLKDIINFYPPDYDEHVEGRKKTYPDGLLPYTAFQAPLWRVFRHLKLHGKTAKQWRAEQAYLSSYKDTINKPPKRHIDKLYWNVEEWIDYIKENKYSILTKAKTAKALQREVKEYEKQLNKHAHVDRDIHNTLKRKRIDKKTKRRRKDILNKYSG